MSGSSALETVIASALTVFVILAGILIPLTILSWLKFPVARLGEIDRHNEQAARIAVDRIEDILDAIIAANRMDANRRVQDRANVLAQYKADQAKRLAEHRAIQAKRLAEHRAIQAKRLAEQEYRANHKYM